MPTPLISGVYAAVLTPRRADDRIDVDALSNLVRFLIAKGLHRSRLTGRQENFA